MLQPSSAHFTRVSISYHETEGIIQDLALKLSSDCCFLSPMKCYMYPANSWTQGCHRKPSLMGSSEISPSNYVPLSWEGVFIEENQNHKKCSTTDHRMGLAPVSARSRSLGVVLSVACWPQERGLTLCYRQESIAMAPLGAQTSCKLLQWLTLMCWRCNIESW